MEVIQENASSIPGIISVPASYINKAHQEHIISVASNVRAFMVQENIPSAQVIYFDTYEEALKFREELSVESQK